MDLCRCKEQQKLKWQDISQLLTLTKEQNKTNYITTSEFFSHKIQFTHISRFKGLVQFDLSEVFCSMVNKVNLEESLKSMTLLLLHKYCQKRSPTKDQEKKKQ